MIYLSEWAKYLLEKYFDPCGLKELLIEELENELPRQLAKVTGRTENYWRNILSKPGFKMVDAGLEFAVELAKDRSEKFDKSFCEYLSNMVLKGSIVKYIVNYIKVFYSASSKPPKWLLPEEPSS